MKRTHIAVLILSAALAAAYLPGCGKKDQALESKSVAVTVKAVKF